MDFSICDIALQEVEIHTKGMTEAMIMTVNTLSTPK